MKNKARCILSEQEKTNKHRKRAKEKAQETQMQRSTHSLTQKFLKNTKLVAKLYMLRMYMGKREKKCVY